MGAEACGWHPETLLPLPAAYLAVGAMISVIVVSLVNTWRSIPARLAERFGFVALVPRSDSIPRAAARHTPHPNMHMHAAEPASKGTWRAPGGRADVRAHMPTRPHPYFPQHTHTRGSCPPDRVQSLSNWLMPGPAGWGPTSSTGHCRAAWGVGGGLQGRVWRHAGKTCTHTVLGSGSPASPPGLESAFKSQAAPRFPATWALSAEHDLTRTP